MADQDDRTVSKDGYDLTFYPGFASRCTVEKADGSTVELYKQDKPFHLPNGQTRPRDRYRIHLKGGGKKQDVAFDVHDPEHRVKRITVELYGEDHETGTGEESETAERLTLDNNSYVCPPFCDLIP